MHIETEETPEYDQIRDPYLQDVERADSWNNLYERPFMIELIGDRSHTDVLDLGAATGFYSHYFCSRGARVIAVDKSKSMLDYMEQRAEASDKVTVVQADLEMGLGFVRSASQDLVLASLVFHYLADWSVLVSDIHRVLVSGGRLLISMHHPFTDFLSGKRANYHESVLVNDVWGEGENRYPIHYYSTSLGEIFTRLQAGGLRLTRLSEPPIPGGNAGARLGVSDSDLLKPGLLFLELTKD